MDTTTPKTIRPPLVPRGLAARVWHHGPIILRVCIRQDGRYGYRARHTSDALPDRNAPDVRR
jgi:hypothetical protein